MKASFLAIAILLVCGHMVCAREPTSEDYDVWNAVIAEHNPGRAVYVWHLVEPTHTFDRGETKSAVDSLVPEVRPVQQAWADPPAELDLQKMKDARRRFDELDQFRYSEANSEIRLFDAAMLSRLGVHATGPWLFSPKLIAGAETIYRLSWPAYREDRRAAFLICAVCTQWSGAVITYQIDKSPVDGRWHQGQSAKAVFAHWKERLMDDGS